MRHVLFYTDTPNVGGAEKQMLLLARHLKPAGFNVSLAYGLYSALKTLRPEFEKQCERVYEIPAFGKHDPRHYFGLKKILRDGKFDLVHLHLWNPGSCRYAFLATKGFPLVTTEHDPFELSGLKRAFKKSALRRTSQTVALSRQNQEFMMSEYELSAQKLNLVPNGIELEAFRGEPQKAALPVLPGDTVITCIAELHPRKGHKYLLDAFLKLQKTIPHLQLVLVGEGPLRSELEKKYSSPNIHFLGWREDIPQILAASDMLVLPSLKEAFGLVILEAMASRVPVIATRAGGVPDLIESGKTGYLVPSANSDKIESAILNLLHNSDQKKDVVETAYQTVGSHFTAQKMAESTAQVYQKILSP